MGENKRMVKNSLFVDLLKEILDKVEKVKNCVMLTILIYIIYLTSKDFKVVWYLHLILCNHLRYWYCPIPAVHIYIVYIVHITVQCHSEKWTLQIHPVQCSVFFDKFYRNN